MSFDDLKYRMNETPCSARELLREAKFFDPKFGSDGIKSTSEAAQILRRNGIKVDENNDF